MEERRRVDDKQWEKVNAYIDESREYRAALNVKLDHSNQKIDGLAVRVDELEKNVSPLVASDAGRQKIENVVGTVVVAGITVVVGAVFLWVGKSLLTAFKSGG